MFLLIFKLMELPCVLCEKYHSAWGLLGASALPAAETLYQNGYYSLIPNAAPVLERGSTCIKHKTPIVR